VSDTIRIDGLEIWPHIGWPEEERVHSQLLRVTVVMKVKSITEAAQLEDLTKTVNYYDVAERIKALATEKPRRLIETLAEDIAAAVLTHYPVKRVTVELHKYILPDTRHIALTIERKAPKDKKSGTLPVKPLLRAKRVSRPGPLG
jgi:phosphoglycolate phosphatase/dihydroneopterin aldolase